MITELVMAAVGVVVAVIGYLLARKDAHQEKQIEALWEKHDQDAARLQDVELDIAKRHYVKDELDARFGQLDSSIRTGLDTLGAKFDKLTEALIHRGANGQ